MIGVMTAVARMVGGNSGKYFVRQQLDLANITGFVEERMTGQRVVKVFNHERISEEEFDQLNEVCSSVHQRHIRLQVSWVRLSEIWETYSSF